MIGQMEMALKPRAAIPRSILQMSGLTLNNLADATISSWVTAIYCFESMNGDDQHLLEIFNQRSLAADYHILSSAVKRGYIANVASHPLLYTLPYDKFKVILSQCRSRYNNDTDLENLLFACTLHRLRWPKSKTLYMDGWIRRCLSVGSERLELRATQALAILTMFKPSDCSLIIQSLTSVGRFNRRQAAAVRAIFFGMQVKEYKARALSILSNASVAAQFNRIQGQRIPTETRIYLDGIIRG